MLTVLTSATDVRLTTVANVKEVLNLTDSVDEPFLDRLILRASARVASYCGRELLVQKYQTVLPSYGGPHLQLPQYPIVSVSRVFDGSDTGPGGSVELSATEYQIDQAEGQLYRDYTWRWSKRLDPHTVSDMITPDGERRKWLIEFTAGYVGPKGTTSTGLIGSTSTGSTLPAEIEDATIELVKSAYLARKRGDDVKSESVGDVSVTYKDTGSRALPQTVKDLLDPFRSVI